MPSSDQSFQDWIDAHGLRAYVQRCASGSLGMQAPGILALREAFERERLAALVPGWWWQAQRGVPGF